LALQGGGSHGAYGAGVIKALLDSGRFRVAAVSGTSAGALNAAALVHGLSEAQTPEAGVKVALRVALRHLERLWTEVGRRSPLGAADALPRPAQPLTTPLVRAWLKSASLLGRFVSPYPSRACRPPTPSDPFFMTSST
jgi:NTE family protein